MLGHGTQGGWLSDGAGNVISPQNMSKYLKSLPGYKQGQPVTLYACYMGDGGKDSYAQQLSNHLGAGVIAPTDKLNTCDLGAAM